jgi:hypothetical protein
MVPCLDILSMLCEQVLERVPLLIKQGHHVPADMFMTLQTLAYGANRANIEELSKVRYQMQLVYGSAFVNASETEPNSINETVRDNINLIMPDMGHKLYRLTEIAKKEGLSYMPSEIHRPKMEKYMRDIGLMPPVPVGPPANQQPYAPMPQSGYYPPPSGPGYPGILAFADDHKHRPRSDPSQC